jgi:hypothetical protein
VLPWTVAPPVDAPPGFSEEHPKSTAVPANAVNSTGTRTDIWE